eukprot:765032-Hanusia_phi.AAC.5
MRNGEEERDNKIQIETQEKSIGHYLCDPSLFYEVQSRHEIKYKSRKSYTTGHLTSNHRPVQSRETYAFATTESSPFDRRPIPFFIPPRAPIVCQGNNGIRNSKSILCNHRRIHLVKYDFAQNILYPTAFAFDLLARNVERAVCQGH